MQATQRPVLLVGRFGRSRIEAITRWVTGIGMDIEIFESTELASQWLQESDPFAVLLGASSSAAEKTCLAVRASPRLTMVPVLGLAEEIGDLAFADIYGWGGDDVVAIDRPELIERRLKMIPRDLPLQPAPARGSVVVADTDHRRRMLIARVMRNSGFDVHFSVDVAELAESAVRPEVTLVIADVDLEGGGAIEALSKARGAGSVVPWVVATPPKKFGDTTARSQQFGPVTIYDSYAPAENALFLANEAVRGVFADKRASARLLFGATVAFRVGGRDHDDHGYTYNISAEGLYIRTMAPLSSGDEAWLEFKPPRTDRLVRLEAKVVWQRLHGPGHGATVPPGFGLRITGGSESDMGRYRQGYEAFAKDLAASRMSVRPVR